VCSDDYTKLGGVADTPEGCAAIQRDLERLKKWAVRNLIRFIRKSAKSCTWGGTPPCINICWRPSDWKACFQERT